MRKRPAPVSSISKTRRVCLHNRNNAGRFVFVSWQTRRAVSAALLHSLALCPNTSKTRPKTRQKRPKTGANVVLFRRNLLNFCILLIRPKRGQTKRRARRLLSGGWSTLHTGRAKHAPRFYHTAGGVEALPLRGCSIFAPAARRGAGLQCSEIHDERTTHGRGLGGALRLCPRSRVHVSPLSFL